MVYTLLLTFDEANNKLYLPWLCSSSIVLECRFNIGDKKIIAKQSENTKYEVLQNPLGKWCDLKIK